MSYFHRYTCVVSFAIAALCVMTVHAATAHVNSGPLNINGQNGTVIENLHITNPNGPCVTITNSTNITIHNSDIGPCGTQAISLNGGDNVKILDSYLHAENAGIVSWSGNQSVYDNGDNIFCTNTGHLLVQGNVIAWGEANAFTSGCSNALFKGNFFLNPINSINMGNRGSSIQALDGSFNTTVDNNYFMNSTDTATWKYPTWSTDIINFGSIVNGRNYGGVVNNNYVVGGTFDYGCGINMEGGENGGIITNNVVIDSGTCGIAIEDGFNYTVSGNRVYNRTTKTINDVGFALINLYVQYGHSCGNITLTNNLAYSVNASGGVYGIYDPNECSNVIYGAGNIFDSGPGGGAYNAMTPVSTKMPPPMIPPAPYSCAVISPFTNQTAQSCNGAAAPAVTVSVIQPSANATVSGATYVSATCSSGVTSVSFVLDNGTTLGQAASYPWAITVDTTKIANGSHTFAAIATQSGVQTKSASIPVTIQNTVSAPPPALKPLGMWTMVNPAGGSYSLNGTALVLNVPGGSNHDPAYGGVNNSVRVMQTAGNVDFTLETKFNSIPGSEYQFEGILVQQDASNYLRFQFGSTGSILVVGADSIISKVENDLFSPVIAVPAGTPSLWMRVQRSGNSWTQSWSPDGKNYTTVGSFTQAFTVTSVGPFAANYNNVASQAPAFTSVIDYFNNIAPIAPAAVVSDNFNMSPVPATGGMNTSTWTMVAPAGGTYKMSGTELLMTAPAGSNHDPAFGGVNNSVRVIQTTGNADFTIEARFNSIPKLGYQFEGILVGQDAANYLRFQFGSTGSILVVGADVVASKVGSTMFSPVISLPAGTASLWMRVAKSGNTWTQTWSADGKTYTTAGSFTQALNVTSVGPFVGNYNGTPTATPAFTSAVDYFINTTPPLPAAPISDNFNR